MAKVRRLPNKAKPGVSVSVYGPGLYNTIVIHNTKCKHGDGDCEVCGTTDLADRKHSTVNGEGKVARLRRKK
jgi:hypothetical protein